MCRMVCSTAWSEEYSQRPNLFTVGFDRAVIGWSVQQREAQEEKEGFRYTESSPLSLYYLKLVNLSVAN